MKAIEIINMIMIFFAIMTVIHIVMIILGKWKLSLGYKLQLAFANLHWESGEPALLAEINSVKESINSHQEKEIPDGIRVALIDMTNRHIQKYSHMLTISTKSDEVIQLKEQHDELAALRQSLLNS